MISQSVVKSLLGRALPTAQIGVNVFANTQMRAFGAKKRSKKTKTNSAGEEVTEQEEAVPEVRAAPVEPEPVAP